MAKNILVICSSPEGSDYKREENQEMLKSFFPKGFVPDFLSGNTPSETFPTGLPKDKKYHAILFMGCNILSNLFSEEEEKNEAHIRQIESLLTPKGFIIFTESEGYFKKGYPEHYDAHALSATIEQLFNHPIKGWQNIKAKYAPAIPYWNKIFKLKTSVVNAKIKYKYKYFVYMSRNKGEPEEKPAASVREPAMAEENKKCEEILKKIEEIISAGGTASSTMGKISDVLKSAGIAANVGRKGTARKTNTKTNTSINALSGEEACKETLRRIKKELQDTGNSVNERLQAIRLEVKGKNYPNITAKAPKKSTPFVSSGEDFFEAFDASQGANRSIEGLNEIFKVNLLNQDAVYDKDTVEASTILKSGAEKTTFSVEKGRQIKEDIIRKSVVKGSAQEKEAIVIAKITEEREKSLRDFRLLYEDFADTCEDVKITLECMHASGNNSDCFFHSFFGATSEFYRMAKTQKKSYNSFVTRFRKEIAPKIIRFFFEQEEKPHVAMSEEDLIENLNAPGSFLSDDLYTIIAYYYNCAILLIRPEGADGIRVASLIGNNTDNTYGISNSGGVHFEPLRIVGENTYKLNDSQAKCLSYTYSQLSGTTAKVDVSRFMAMDYVVGINKEKGDGTIEYDEDEMLRTIQERGSNPGDITRVYMGMKGEGYDEAKTGQVRNLQELIGRLTKNYKSRGLYADPEKSEESQELEEKIQIVQQGIVDGTMNEDTIAEKRGEVEEFLEAFVLANAEKAKKKKEEEAKREERRKKKGKKGGRRTVRKQRAGRKTYRA